jgi:hypothetical protein
MHVVWKSWSWLAGAHEEHAGAVDTRLPASPCAADDAAEPASYRGKHRLWMTEYAHCLADKSLTQVKMIGTHNSATHTIDSKTSKGTHPGAAKAIAWLAKTWVTKRATMWITTPWAKCQRHSVRRQLEDGVRYLDVRVGVRRYVQAVEAASPESSFVNEPEATPEDVAHEELWTCHTVWGCRFRDVVRDIVGFLESLPADHREIIILDLQKSFGFTDPHHEELLATMLHPLADYIIHSDPTAGFSEPLRDIWATPGRVLVLYHNEQVAASSPVFSSARAPVIVSKWINTRDITDLHGRLEGLLLRGLSSLPEHLLEGSDTTLLDTQLFVTQGVLSPTQFDVTAGALMRPVNGIVYRSIEDMAHVCNPVVLELWETLKIEVPVAKAPVADVATTPPATPALPEAFPTIEESNTTTRRDLRNILLLDYYELGTSPSGRSAVELCIALNEQT